MLHGLPLYGEAFLPRNRRDACPSCHGHNGRMGRHACECRQDAGAQGKAKGREWACPQVWGRIGSACPSTGGKKRRMAEQGIGLPGTRLRTAVPVVCFGRQPDLPAVETGASFAAILRPCPATVPRRTHPVRVARQVSVWCHMASHQGGNLFFCRLSDLSEHLSGLALGCALVCALPGGLRDSLTTGPCGHGRGVS